MKGSHPEIVGSTKPMYESYNVIASLNPTIHLENIYGKRIHMRTEPISESMITYEDERFMKLLWRVRYYEKGHSFVDSLGKIEKRLFRVSEEDREMQFLHHLSEHIVHLTSDMIICYKQNKIQDKMEDTLRTFREIGEICKSMIHTLHPTHYRITLQLCHKIFERCRILVYKYRLL